MSHYTYRPKAVKSLQRTEFVTRIVVIVIAVATVAYVLVISILNLENTKTYAELRNDPLMVLLDYALLLCFATAILAAVWFLFYVAHDVAKNRAWKFNRLRERIAELPGLENKDDVLKTQSASITYLGGTAYLVRYLHSSQSDRLNEVSETERTIYSNQKVIIAAHPDPFFHLAKPLML